MKQLLACTLLLGIVSSAAATEYGNVISANPVVQRSTVMLSSCVNTDGSVKPGCESIGTPQSHVIGYQIQYLYKDHTYSAQVPSDPGKTVALRFDPNSGEPTPAIAHPMTDPYAAMATPPIAPYPSAPAAPVTSQPPLAYAPPYYGPAYYDPAYYGQALYGPPVLGMDVGVGIGFGGSYGGWGHSHGGWGGHRR